MKKKFTISRESLMDLFVFSIDLIVSMTVSKNKRDLGKYETIEDDIRSVSIIKHI